MDAKARIIRVVKLSLLLLIPILTYNVGTTALLTSSMEHPEATSKCQSSGVEPSLQIGSTVDIVVDENTTTLSPDKNTSVEFSFSSTDINIVKIEGFESTADGYVSKQDEFSILSYDIKDSQNSAFGRLSIQDGNYTILPEISGDSGYNISPEQNLYGNLVYAADTYTTDYADVGCQGIEYFASGEYDIRTHEKMLERTSGRIPFNKNFSNIEVVFVDGDLDFEGVDAGAISTRNIILVEKDKNRRALFLHEYIHTRQEYYSLQPDMRRPWFIEGSAQYHSLDALKQSGYINRYEYNYIVSKWLKQADNLNTSEAYDRTDTYTNHYAFGPIVFQSYEEDVGELGNYTDGNTSLPDYYRSYKIDGGVCSDTICKVSSAGLGILYDFHKLPILYVLFPVYLILLEIIGVVKSRLFGGQKSGHKNEKVD